MEWIQAQNGDSREFLAASLDRQCPQIVFVSLLELTATRCFDELVPFLPRLTLLPCCRWTLTLPRLSKRSGRSSYHANLIRGMS